MRYADKMKQAHREARATVVALVLTVVVWLALGFGLAGTGIELFHTPIWIIGGTVGTWLFAIAVAVFMSKRVISDVDLNDETDPAQTAEPIRRAEAGEAHE